MFHLVRPVVQSGMLGWRQYGQSAVICILVDIPTVWQYAAEVQYGMVESAVWLPGGIWYQHMAANHQADCWPAQFFLVHKLPISPHKLDGLPNLAHF